MTTNTSQNRRLQAEPLLPPTKAEGSIYRDKAKNVLLFLLGAAFACIVLRSGQKSSLEAPTTNLWLNEPQNDFKWNMTRALDWSSLTAFINIAASPNGELYGIQWAKTAGGDQYFAYRFSFVTG
jgi:hypothetical protein